MLDHLEPRRMFASVNLTPDGVLVIEGGDGDDVIYVSLNTDGKYEVLDYADNPQFPRASVKAACYEHEGRTPLFVQVLLPTQEVVLRVKELGVDPAPDLVAKVEGLLGAGSILVEYAGRA